MSDGFSGGTDVDCLWEEMCILELWLLKCSENQNLHDSDFSHCNSFVFNRENVAEIQKQHCVQFYDPH